MEHITLTTDKGWRLREDAESYYQSRSDTDRGSLYLTDSFILGPESGVDRVIPFEPEPGECLIVITVNGKIPAKEFGLPGFMDDFKIKPVEGRLIVEVEQETDNG